MVSNPPIEQGERYDILIEDQGDEGDGIARIDGFVVFVPDAEPGENVSIEITNVAENFGFAEKV